jgi:hypothetical protein
LACSSTLQMVMTRSSETSVEFQRISRSFIPEDKILRKHWWENLKSYSVRIVSVSSGFWTPISRVQIRSLTAWFTDYVEMLEKYSHLY